MIGAVYEILRANPLVFDNYVIQRAREDGTDECVAYVVADAAVDAGQLEKQLSNGLPEQSPCKVVLLPRIPLHNDGSVDESALTRLPVVDEWLEARWESKLEQLPSVERACVLRQPVSTIMERIHLADVLPEGQLQSADDSGEVEHDCDAGEPLTVNR